MPKLVANAPAKRLEWVLKTYFPKYTMPVADTFLIAVHLLGIETQRALNEDVDAASDLAMGALMQGKDRTGQIRVYFAAFIDLLSTTRHENDFLIPWVAKQLVALWRAVGSDDVVRAQLNGDFASDATVTVSDYSDAVRTLVGKAPAIAMWARESRTDIGRVTLAQALEAIADYEFKTRLVPQGTTVYSFDDGYTIQELRTEPELKAEGDVMQHCVGSYCSQVTSGESRIYSLRDQRGNPHVTMEWQVDSKRMEEYAGRDDTIAEMTPERFLRSSLRHRGHFVQIYGKQNDDPAEKYKPYVQDFIRREFAADPLSLLRAGVPVRDLDFRNQDLDDVDFSDHDLSGVRFTGSSLMAANFQNSKLRDADFRDANLRYAQFDFCDMTGADLSGADLSNALLHGARLNMANVDGATFTDANWGGGTKKSERFSGMRNTDTAIDLDESYAAFDEHGDPTRAATHADEGAE